MSFDIGNFNDNTTRETKASRTDSREELATAAFADELHCCRSQKSAVDTTNNNTKPADNTGFVALTQPAGDKPRQPGSQALEGDREQRAQALATLLNTPNADRAAILNAIQVAFRQEPGRVQGNSEIDGSGNNSSRERLQLLARINHLVTDPANRIRIGPFRGSNRNDAVRYRNTEIPITGAAR